MKTLHVITSLNNPRGAQTMLYRLLSSIDRAAFESKVVSLTDIGPIGEKIHALGVASTGARHAPGSSKPNGFIAACSLAQARPS